MPDGSFPTAGLSERPQDPAQHVRKGLEKVRAPRARGRVLSGGRTPSFCLFSTL